MRYATAPPEGAVIVMPEMHIPVCAPSLVECVQKGRAKRIGFDGNDRLSADLGVTFGDYAIVLQAALAGQGIADGWLNIVAQWLQSELLCACGPITRTGRLCFLHTTPATQDKDCVPKVAEWLRSQIIADIQSLGQSMPELGLKADDWGY